MLKAPPLIPGDLHLSVIKIDPTKEQGAFNKFENMFEKVKIKVDNCLCPIKKGRQNKCSTNNHTCQTRILEDLIEIYIIG